MSFSYIRDYYGVPAEFGARVSYKGKPGRLVSADHYAHIILDGEDFSIPYHPLDDDLIWLDALEKK